MKNSPKKKAPSPSQDASEKAMLALIHKVLAERNKERVAKKRIAYEAKLWRNYKALSSNLVRFYERQRERNEQIAYADGSNLADNLFEKGSVLQMIDEINKKMKKEESIK